MKVFIVDECPLALLVDECPLRRKSAPPKLRVENLAQTTFKVSFCAPQLAFCEEQKIIV